MANREHLAILKQGVAVWNEWRDKNPKTRPDLSGADMSGAKLREANFYIANFAKAQLAGVDFADSNLCQSNLSGANLNQSHLLRANCRSGVLRGADFTSASCVSTDFTRADLRGATLHSALLFEAVFVDANLVGAFLDEAILDQANFSGADLSGAALPGAFLDSTNLSGANLSGASLMHAHLVKTNLQGANLSNCFVYGISAWDLNLERATQSNLVITPEDAPTLTIDNLEVAQFIYMLVNNKKIRDVIDTVARKVVLILGRFTPERKTILDAIREELRKRDYLPVLFDFNKPVTRDFTETVRTLAHLSRFIIADLTDPSSIPQELQAIVPDLAVPVQPILLASKCEYGMFIDFQEKYHWVLPIHHYINVSDLLTSLGIKVIAPAEAKAKELEKR